MGGTFSAQVILEPAASPEAVDELRRALAAAGLTPGPAVGGNFSVTAARPRMEAVFNVGIAADGAGTPRVTLHGDGDAPAPGEMPLDALPEEWRRAIKAVVFTHRPDFGF